MKEENSHLRMFLECSGSAPKSKCVECESTIEDTPVFYRTKAMREDGGFIWWCNKCQAMRCHCGARLTDTGRKTELGNKLLFCERCKGKKIRRRKK